jgi:NTP pyrophosphatase (non-canonical NTP hydrolase)
MNDKLMETLGILQEECAEVIQAISKYRRFGDDNAEKIEQEIGDVLCLILLLEKQGFINERSLEEAVHRKVEKLKIYSSIVD